MQAQAIANDTSERDRLLRVLSADIRWWRLNADILQAHRGLRTFALNVATELEQGKSDLQYGWGRLRQG